MPVTTPPDKPTPEILAEDLSLSNMEGTSWFVYGYLPIDDVLIADLYNDEGKVVKRFQVRTTFEEVPVE